MDENAQTLGDHLSELRAQYSAEPQKIGRQFENLMRRRLQSDKLYRFTQVTRWADWARTQGINATDTGIDLVAKTQDGDHWAVQCKCYAPDHTIQKADIDSFFTASGKTHNGIRFAARLILSTTGNWSKNAEDALQNQNPPCQRWDITDEELQADLADLTPRDASRRAAHATAVRKPRPHQTAAINAVIRGFATADRGKLIMACGTGKTYTALKIAEKFLADTDTNAATNTILFLVPSLSLLSQTLREWSQHATIPMRFFAVCSDTKVGQNEEDIRAHDLAIPPTTNAKHLHEQLAKACSASGTHAGTAATTPTVIFSTYHSIRVITQAQQHGAPAFALVICDEAHRTTGIEAKATTAEQASHFVAVHNTQTLRAHKRLFMTATPRIYTEAAKTRATTQDITVYSMDDPAKYGEEFYRLDFSTAVAQDLLTDYKVLILTVNQQHITDTLQSEISNAGSTPEIQLTDAGKIIGCWNGLAKKVQNPTESGITDPTPMRRAVAFAQRIKDSKHITDIFTRIITQYRKQYPASPKCARNNFMSLKMIIIAIMRLLWGKQSH